MYITQRVRINGDYETDGLTGVITHLYPTRAIVRYDFPRYHPEHHIFTDEAMYPLSALDGDYWTLDDRPPGLVFSPNRAMSILLDQTNRPKDYNTPDEQAALTSLVLHPISVLGRLTRMAADSLTLP